MDADFDALVIGGGAAGLAATRDLAAAGLRTLLVEARERLGGRILTLCRDGLPLELGAEFVHGSPEVLRELVPGLELETEQVRERHHYLEHGELRLRDDLGDVLHDFIDAARAAGLGGSSVRDALAATRQTPDRARLVLSHVSGLHAAHPERYATAGLFELEPSRERPSGSELHRVTGGYAALIETLARGLERDGARVMLGAPVTRIEWRQGRVRAITQGGARFDARRAVITLPLGVLLARSVSFEPEIDSLIDAASELGAGSVVRALLVFERSPWQGEGFLHDPKLPFPAFWPTGRGGRRALAGWASAHAADALKGASEAELRRAATSSLAELLGTRVSELERALVHFAVKDWQTDPFSRGAYSYGLAGCREPWQRLAQPIEDTLFFAGEATDTGGQDATVTGALSSGRRAARELIRRARA